jgi:hypothetical protein
MSKKKIDYSEWDIRTLPKKERPKPTTGQHGPKVDLEWDDLSADQKAVIARLKAKSPAHVADIAEKGFGKDDPKLRVRNALRRLVRGGWVEHASKEPGMYRLALKARRAKAKPRKAA